MSETETVPEQTENQDNSDTQRLKESLKEATAAAMKALYQFLLVLSIIAMRAIQALFVLARPAVMIACVVAAGYASVTLFSTVLVRYGSELPAMILALTAVTIIPATLIILAEKYGLWGTMLATAAIEFLAHLGLQRAPPLILASVPVLALAAATLTILFKDTNTNEEEPNEREQGNIGTVVDSERGADHVHHDQNLQPD